MNTETLQTMEPLPPEDEAFLDDLQELMASGTPEELPREYEVALKRQTRDRLAPEEVRFPEVAVLSLIALVVMGLGGVEIWTLANLLVIGPAVVIYSAATLALGAEERDYRD